MMIDNKRLMTLLYNAIDVIRELYCAEGDEVETDESIEHIFYCMTNFSQDEYMEVKIVEKELP